MFRGWVRTSLIDFPEHIATVLFAGGCNFRCPMCHNAPLVLHPAQTPAVDLDDVWDFLARRRGMIDGIVLTGGEPTLQPGLLPLAQEARERGFYIKLDTNGYLPHVLKELIDGKLIDYVAMDVKAPPEKYARVAGVPDLDLARIEGSMQMLREAGIPYEFRTTVAPGLLDENDITRIARWIAGAPTYALQQFRPAGTLSPAMQTVTPFTTAVLHRMAESASQWVDSVAIRGI
jgi:pyruvate formate lyase activating enzyme